MPADSSRQSGAPGAPIDPRVDASVARGHQHELAVPCNLRLASAGGVVGVLGAMLVRTLGGGR
jgi:hypothetical protein